MPRVFRTVLLLQLFNGLMGCNGIRKESIGTNHAIGTNQAKESTMKKGKESTMTQVKESFGTDQSKESAEGKDDDLTQAIADNPPVLDVGNAVVARGNFEAHQSTPTMSFAEYTFGNKINPFGDSITESTDAANPNTEPTESVNPITEPTDPSVGTTEDLAVEVDNTTPAGEARAVGESQPIGSQGGPEEGIRNTSPSFPQTERFHGFLQTFQRKLQTKKEAKQQTKETIEQMQREKKKQTKRKPCSEPLCTPITDPQHKALQVEVAAQQEVEHPTKDEENTIINVINKVHDEVWYNRPVALFEMLELGIIGGFGYKISRQLDNLIEQFKIPPQNQNFNRGQGDQQRIEEPNFDRNAQHNRLGVSAKNEQPQIHSDIQAPDGHMLPAQNRDVFSSKQAPYSGGGVPRSVSSEQLSSFMQETAATTSPKTTAKENSGTTIHVEENAAMTTPTETSRGFRRASESTSSAFLESGSRFLEKGASFLQFGSNFLNSVWTKGKTLVQGNIVEKVKTDFVSKVGSFLSDDA